MIDDFLHLLYCEKNKINETTGQLLHFRTPRPLYFLLSALRVVPIGAEQHQVDCLHPSRQGTAGTMTFFCHCRSRVYGDGSAAAFWATTATARRGIQRAAVGPKNTWSRPSCSHAPRAASLSRYRFSTVCLHIFIDRKKGKLPSGPRCSCCTTFCFFRSRPKVPPSPGSYNSLHQSLSVEQRF
ncbi:unnamed protein product [Amoebophrya sp. A120]|nr:unnamed protein product [Amoebophrya sp. A120]|eukprot:GSA120T00021767001.1